MKLFVLELVDYDYTYSVALLAINELRARQFAFEKNFTGDQDNNDWLDSNKSTCKEISLNDEVIITTSFHAR